MATDTGDQYEQCRRLLEAWELGQVTGLERQLVGASNRVYRVEADAGVSFLRIYRRAERALAEREHALITPSVRNARARSRPAP